MSEGQRVNAWQGQRRRGAQRVFAQGGAVEEDVDLQGESIAEDYYSVLGVVSTHRTCAHTHASSFASGGYMIPWRVGRLKAAQGEGSWTFKGRRNC